MRALLQVLTFILEFLPLAVGVLLLWIFSPRARAARDADEIVTLFPRSGEPLREE